MENRDIRPELLQRLELPFPSAKPSEALRHRLTFRNERSLYKRPSTLSGAPLISIYAPDSLACVYSVDEWWSDKWDGAEYARDIDFHRPFFEQFAELARVVPRIALFNINPHNSQYCQQAYNNKNCYLCTVIKDSEDSMYVSHSNRVRDSIDCDYVQDCELCYDCLDSERLYSCIGSDHCQTSTDLLFCLDCIGCANCIGCWGLRNQRYHIYNEPCSKETFATAMGELKLQTRSGYEEAQTKIRRDFWSRNQRKTYNINIEDSTGANLIRARDCVECYDSFQIERCSHCTWIFESHHCADVYGMGTSEWVYESVGVERLNVGAFNTFVSDSGYAFYSDLCFSCTDIFGCVGMRRANHCILNRSYSVGEYEHLRAKLVAHMKNTEDWGKFFPQSHSPFAYNESVAAERFPLSRDESIAAGYRWREPDAREFLSPQGSVPNDSQQAGPELASVLLACEATKKNFRLTAAEIELAKKNCLPLPSICPDERYARRMRRRSVGSV